MELITDLDELADGQLLDHAGEVARLRRELEVQELRVAVSHAIRHNADTLDPELTRLPGRERTRRFGGVGTDDVAEFCCAELGARMGITSYAAASLVADGLDLVIRLPQLWARVEALEVKASYARFVARKTRDLSIDQTAYVDSRVVSYADGRIPWTRFEILVEGAIAASDPEAARAAEEAAATQAYARPNRSDEHGMRGMYLRAPFPVITKFDAMLQQLADALAFQGVGETNDERRVLALLVLCDPDQTIRVLRAHAAHTNLPARATPPAHPDPLDWRALLPAVQLFVHCYTGPEPTGIARVEGHGPVTEAWVRSVLGPHARFTVRPVIDLANQAPVDAYEIPERHRQAVHLMTPADTFPWGSCTTRTQQIDHTVPYRPPDGPSEGADRPAGPSAVGNYGPMSAFHHRVKTHAPGWQVRQPFPGLYLWRDPHGATYLVDHTGTRRLDLGWRHIRLGRGDYALGV